MLWNNEENEYESVKLTDVFFHTDTFDKNLGQKVAVYTKHGLKFFYIPQEIFESLSVELA